MAALDRSRQRDILELLSADYPFATVVATQQQTDAFIANLHYLMEHGLVEASFSRDNRLPAPSPSGERYKQPAQIASNIRITARGMDFLADDGGLSALLTIVNVRKAQP